MLELALEESFLKFQYHKPAFNPLSYLPPTRAKENAKENTRTKHTKSLNVYLNIISRAPKLVFVSVDALFIAHNHKPALIDSL